MSKKHKNKKVKEALPVERTLVPPRIAGPKMASPAQIKWIRSMIDEKDLLKDPSFFERVNAMDKGEYAAYLEHLKASVGTEHDVLITMDRASQLISALKFLPRKGSPNSASNGGSDRVGTPVRVIWEELPDDSGKITRRGRLVLEKGRVLAGSYGLKTPGPEFTNNVTFFKVWINERYGRGWGVQMYVSDDTSRVKIGFDKQLWALEKIAKNPEKAARRFGLEFKRCGICGRGLTNDTSRALGIGPICRERI